MNPFKNKSVAQGSMQDLRDLTAKLEETERCFEGFIHQAPVCFWYKDYSDWSGKMVFISDKVEEAFGISETDWEGKTDSDVFPEMTAKRLRDHDKEVLESGEVSINIEFVPSATDPKWSRCMALRYPIKNKDGAVIAIAGIAWPAPVDE